MLASLIFDVVLAIPADQRKKPISVLCTDTRVEIPAIAEMIEGALRRCRKCSQQHNLNIDATLLKPRIEESYWVNSLKRSLRHHRTRLSAPQPNLPLSKWLSF